MIYARSASTPLRDKGEKKGASVRDMCARIFPVDFKPKPLNPRPALADIDCVMRVSHYGSLRWQVKLAKSSESEVVLA